jgi:hypothetical protein
MRAPLSPLDAAILVLAAGSAIVLARVAARLVPDIWVIANALLQPAR